MVGGLSVVGARSPILVLYSHLYFKSVIQSMTAVSEIKLRAYHLSEEQCSLAEDLQAVLAVLLSPPQVLISADQR